MNLYSLARVIIARVFEPNRFAKLQVFGPPGLTGALALVAGMPCTYQALAHRCQKPFTKPSPSFGDHQSQQWTKWPFGKPLL